jgi:hypothetical protein
MWRSNFPKSCALAHTSGECRFVPGRAELNPHSAGEADHGPLVGRSGATSVRTTLLKIQVA